MFFPKDVTFLLPIEQGQDSVSSMLSSFLGYVGHWDTVINQIQTISNLSLGLLTLGLLSQ